MGDADRTKDEQWLEDAGDLPAEIVDPWSGPETTEDERRRRIAPDSADHEDDDPPPGPSS